MGESNGLPVGWIRATLGEVATTQTGGTPSRTRSDFFGGGIPWVKSGELGDGVVYTTEECITEAGLECSNAKLFPKGTLCIALYGATVGKLGILGIDATTNQAVCGIFLPESLDTRYVFRYLQSIRSQLIEQGKGGAQSNISNGLVRQIQLPIAPLDQQRCIVAKIEELFSDLDAGVAALERVRANLKRYRASVLKAAVEGRLTEQWRAEHPDVEPAAVLLERILAERRARWEADQLARFEAAGKKPPKGWKDKYAEPAAPDTSKLPALPKGWCWVTVEQLSARVVDGVHRTPRYVTQGVPFVTVRNLTAGPGISFEKLNYVTKEDHEQFIKRAHPERGDILVSKDGTLGVVRLIDSDVEFSIFVSVALIKPVDRSCSRFFALALASPVVQAQMVGKGIGLQHIHLEDLRQDAIPLAPTDEQEVIVDDVARRVSVIDAAQQATVVLTTRCGRLRQSILKRAFEGRLVPEPAVRTSSGVQGVSQEDGNGR